MLDMNFVLETCGYEENVNSVNWPSPLPLFSNPQAVYLTYQGECLALLIRNDVF